MFATRIGNVRRNSLADFESINRNGKIAMKLEEGDRIVRVAICRPGTPQDAADASHEAGDAPVAQTSDTLPEGAADDESGEALEAVPVTHLDNVLLTTAKGRCVRFPVDFVRLFKGRGSTGVRGVRLDEGDEVISGHPAPRCGDTWRTGGLSQQALSMRRAQGAEVAEVAPEPDAEAETAEGAVELTPERYAELGAHEQFVLTVSSAVLASAVVLITASPGAAARASPP
jgi:DNA gyrase subunit A